MQSFKYFTKEGNVYIKTPPKALYYTLALLILAIALLSFIYGESRNVKLLAGMIGLLGLIILLRTTATSRFDTVARTITAQSMFFLPARVFSFDDFDHFLVNKQSYLGLLTINSTASIIINKNGKKRTLMLHQVMFVTKPLQKVIDEAAQIIGVEQ
ncbi:hypothetical protein [Chitinophaga filiformis]|uniref:PH domain-containing protein n=1 Tax=Chitinophaga filiformis TaxID=104663 RepID=A0A1G7SXJ9_CHIFI|nr:hypothetical protein [Chitinophaga filiformis]SDG27030.1 hypothetical protein SAMN04488121_1031032 [Chitinophaga filiformis]